MKMGCFICNKAQWDADGCTCKQTGLLVSDTKTGCKDIEFKPKKWIKLSTARMSERFQCPECFRVCHCKHAETKYDGRRITVCDYKYCPYCGMKILRSDCPVER